MKKSLRAKRMARHHRRNSRHYKLNLVSLMDIFTILVFFLMINSGDVEVLSTDKSIKLPDSIAQMKPEATLTIKVNADNIVVQGRSVGQLGNPELLELSVEALDRELAYQASRRVELTDKEKALGRSVIIMGDQAMHYDVLKRLMATCSKNDYRDISFAVNRVIDHREVLAAKTEDS